MVATIRHCEYGGIMGTAWKNVVLLIHLLVGVMGVVLYAGSFAGYGWEVGGRFVFVAFLCAFIASIPTVIRDHKFFKEHWGFSFIGLRSHFPFQMFPARREKWLNQLAIFFMAILLLHFFWMIVSTNHDVSRTGSSTDLRYVSLMVLIAGVLGALAWEYPPTEMPQA
jgi:uncharacterized membrane protein